MIRIFIGLALTVFLCLCVITGARFGFIRVASLLLVALLLTSLLIPFLPVPLGRQRRVALTVIILWLCGVLVIVANIQPRVSKVRSVTHRIYDQGWPIVARQTFDPVANPYGKTSIQIAWHPYGIFSNLSILLSLLFAIPTIIGRLHAFRRFSIMSAFIQTTSVAIMTAVASSISKTYFGINESNIAYPFGNATVVYYLVACSFVVNLTAISTMLTALCCGKRTEPRVEPKSPSLTHLLNNPTRRLG